MVYIGYQELLRDIGKVWDQSTHQPNESKDFLAIVHEQYLQSAALLSTQEIIRNQIIEELFEVTNQLIQNTFRNADNLESEDNKVLSISKRGIIGDSFTDFSLESKFNNGETAFSWNAIIGQDDAKRALYECCILPSILPSTLFVGIRQLCKTVLLYGPPGTGKTTLVRMIAHESRFPFIPLIPRLLSY